MTSLELLAPARNMDIGIAAIDCGADAVYIAGPSYGARKDAGNPVEDIARLCEYAHLFGARIYVTFNISVNDDELPDLHAQMLAAQDAGADAFIIRDERIASWDDIRIPLHASTQCAIRDAERARHFEELGCTRIILERELSLEQVRNICSAVNCEVEFFVHGALCVCYSGECRLSEYLNGRSADRGECIQACRSLYDLVDAEGRVLVKDKALLSLKDLKLKDRLEELAEAGICSFKIEGRLKNASYVKNVVRDYSMALDDLVSKHPELYRRLSYGHVTGGFRPDLGKTFNRGYTELYLDGKRGRWSSMDAPKSIGETVGTVRSIKNRNPRECEILVKPADGSVVLRNGDGFSFVAGSAIGGFRGDVCEGMKILCRPVQGLRPGMTLYRNVSSAFEKEMEQNPCRREMDADIKVRIHGKFNIDISVSSDDGKEAFSPFKADLETAQNKERAEAIIREGLSKRTGPYRCHISEFKVETAGGELPLLSSATVNSIRRAVISDLGYRKEDTETASERRPSPAAGADPRIPEQTGRNILMRSKYCIRHELGMCPIHQGAGDSGPLFLLNNGRRLSLGFDCKRCEMTVSVEGARDLQK